MPTVGYATLQIIPSVRGIADDLRRQLVGPAGDAGDRAGEAAGGSLSDKLKVGAAAAGAAAGALLVKGLSDAMDQANVVSSLQAQLGTTNKVAAEQGKLAGKLYSSGVAGSFEDAAEAIKSVMQSGLAPPGATTKQLESLATKASDVANVFGQELGGVTNAVSQMLRTGLAKNADQAFDLITKGFQSGADKAGDFLDTINEYGVQFHKAGLDGQAAIGLLNQAIKGGARDADLAADAIKEFSIRAIDGSDSTKDGFKALGLSADSMAAKFAKGGKAANGVLDLTLDKLRGVKDPVKQASIATALFGTQAEDLGKALFAMDPSKAAAGLGKVGGAAKAAGDTIRSGPQYELQVFTRTLQQGLVSFLGGQVLPLLAQWGGTFNKDVLPPLKTVGGVLASLFLPTLALLGSVLSGTIDWFRQWGVWLAPLAIAIGGVTLALNAQAIATGIVTAVFSVYRAAILVGTAVTNGFAGAQALLNSVMALNPFVLVAIALVALGAALVVAYKRSETFRAIVQAAFSGIKSVALAVYGWFAGPFVRFFTQTVPAAFGSVLSWVGRNWPWLLGALTGPLGLATVYIIKHWDQIRSGLAAGWSWIKSNVLSPIGTWFTKTVPGWAVSLKNRMVAAFDGARAGIKTAWDKIRGIVRAPIQYVVDVVYNSGVRGVWNLVAGAFGAPKLPAFKFASGGVLPGYTPGRDVHLAALSGGEAVMRPEWTRAVGPGYVNSMNAAARTGGVSAIRRMVQGGMPAFADGGIFGWVKNAASKGIDLAKSGVSWLKDGIKESALAGLNKVVKPLIDKIAGSASLYRTMITGIPKRMVSTILGFSGQADKKLSAAGIGGKGYKAALSWARTQNGKPYQWGGNGDPSWDCSGFMSAIESVIRGQKPHRRWATGAFAGAAAPGGWVRGARSPFMIGITNAGVGHTAGTLNGVNVESRGGDGVIVGSRARGYNASLFTDTYGFKGYASGGSPRPGEIAWVGENGPELIRFSGGEVVYSNADSRRIAAGLGQMRGFAKGTGRATARKQVPGDLTSFTKSLTGSAADISKAAAELAKDLKAAGGAGKSLSASTTRASTRLQSLAKQRDGVASRLETARQAASDQRGTARDFLSVSNLSDAGSVFDVIQGMRKRQSTVSAFQSSIKSLSSRGLNQNLIQQLVAMGPDSQLAKLVASASTAEIKQLNVLAKRNGSLASSYGNTMADAMYDAGKNASRGFLTGLVSQEKQLQAAMNRLGDSLVSAIKKKLKIKSPSRVTQPLGAYTGQGFAIGLDSTTAQVAAAAARVSQAAVPAVPDAATRAALRGAGAPPIVVEVHTRDEALAGFIDVRVRDHDQQLIQVINAS